MVSGVQSSAQGRKILDEIRSRNGDVLGDLLEQMTCTTSTDRISSRGSEGPCQGVSHFGSKHNWY